MDQQSGIPDLCQDCRRNKRAEDLGQVKEEQKSDRWKNIREALIRAERCKFFCHHTLFDTDGKEDPMAGKRTCSFTVTAQCGHGVPKYGLCADWCDGKFCGDWQEKS